ncbi:MAG TPA: hypothetical protein VKK19_10685, partial [Candidatus Dormibacteraeota bacterium]|nr:hypothetical protein [Candidatus Dormibacteraeota bacterium]
MDTTGDARRTGGDTPARGGRLRSIAMILIFDVAAPLVAYNVLRAAGLTAVTALLLSGVFPALGVAIGAVRNGGLTLSAPWCSPGSPWARYSAWSATAPGCSWSRGRCPRAYSAWRAWA